MDSDKHGATHTHSHPGQLLVLKRSGKESFLFPTSKELKHTAKIKFDWFHSKRGSPGGWQGKARTGFVDGGRRSCRAGGAAWRDRQ